MQISGNPFISAYQGMQNGFNQLGKESEVLASPNRPDKTEALVNLKQDEVQVQASAKAAKTADNMIGTIIDIFV